MTNAEAWFNIALHPWKPEGSLGRTAQDGHLDSHTAPELCVLQPKQKHYGVQADPLALGFNPSNAIMSLENKQPIKVGNLKSLRLFVCFSY